MKKKADDQQAKLEEMSKQLGQVQQELMSESQAKFKAQMEIVESINKGKLMQD